MLKRLMLGFLVLVAAGCGGDNATTTMTGGTDTTAGEVTFPLLVPEGEIVAQECPFPQERPLNGQPTVGVCTYFPLGTFGAARVPATTDLMPEFVSGSECLVLWFVRDDLSSMSPTCYRPGAEPSQPQIGAISNNANQGYNYGSVLVPEGTIRVIGRTTNGIDLISIPSHGIALLWWPGDVIQGALASLYAETPSGRIELNPG
jgi:hypothetical protein